MIFLARRLLLLLLALLLLPLLAPAGFALLVCNLLCRLAGSSRSQTQVPAPAAEGTASIVILNWNGKDLLAEGLPSVVRAVAHDGLDHEIIVVDNGSTDGSREFVRAHFPSVRLLELPANLGFGEGNNAGVRAARNEIVVLLNNDMAVDRGFLRPLLEAFEPETFAVASQIFLQDPSARREETGKTSARFRLGMIEYTHLPLEGAPAGRSFYPVFWAGGGASAFRRSRFLELGGFDPLYSPAYVEDTDLSYRAWKQGWDVRMAPGSVVHHRHRASSSRRFEPGRLEALVLRNQLLFFWKNISSWRRLTAHCLLLPLNCYRLARDRGLGVLWGLAGAMLRIPVLQLRRLASRRPALRSDEEIFRLFEFPGAYFSWRRARSAAGSGDGAVERAADRRPRMLWMTAYLPHLGRHAGAGRMFQLLARLSKRYRITLLSFLEADDEREFLPGLEALCEEVVAMRRQPPLRWQLFPYEPFDEFRTPGMQEALDRRLEQRDFDLIQLEYTQMACYANRHLGIPTLLTKHEVDFAACARRMRHERSPVQKVRRLYNYLQVLDREIRLTRGADAAICMTEPDRAELARFCHGLPLHVVNTGVDLEYFTPAAGRTADNRMIFVGAFQHDPNVDAMIYFCREVLPRIRAEAPEAELLIVGSKPPQSIAALGELPGVQVTGFVSDIRPLMADSAVYVVPLRLGVGIRGKILEAWGMAMPVVATSVGCAGLRCRHGANALIADAASDFAAQVLSLFRDRSLAARLGAEGRRTAERHYCWDALAAQLAALYETYARTPAARLQPAAHEGAAAHVGGRQ